MVVDRYSKAPTTDRFFVDGFFFSPALFGTIAALRRALESCPGGTIYIFYLAFIYSFLYQIDVLPMQWLSPLLRFFLCYL